MKIYNLLKNIFFIKTIDMIEVNQYSPIKLRRIISTIKRLSLQPDEELTSTELDHYLVLPNKDYSWDSVKSVRARRIKEINRYYKSKTGEKFIIRKRRDPIDRRYFIYSINKKFV